MKTYVLMISQYFPAYHARAGASTDFPSLIIEGEKIHTIRHNWKLWQRRIQAVNEGKAVVSVRYWSGKPYRSPQVELIQLKAGEVGFQKLENTVVGFFIDDVDSDISTSYLAKNDGLSLLDFCNWFKTKMRTLPFEKPMGIIHFTKFRYS